MKKLFIILFSIILLAGCGKKADEGNLGLKVSFDESNFNDTLYIGIHSASLAEKLPPAYELKKTIEHQTAISLDPGVYTVSVVAFGYEPVKEIVIVEEPEKKITLQAKLNKLGIPEKIESVKLVGDFCSWKKEGAIELKNEGDSWKSDDYKIMNKGETYKFLINNELFVYDIKNRKAMMADNYSTFDNYYENNEIEFSPRNYQQPVNKSEASTEGNTKTEEYKAFLTELNGVKKITDNVLDNFRSISDKDFAEKCNEITEMLSGLEKKYALKYGQKILEFRLENLGYINPEFRKYYLMRRSSSEEEVQKYISSGEFVEMLKERKKWISQLDYSSPYLGSNFLEGVIFLMDMTNIDGFEGDIEKTTTNDLYTISKQYVGKSKNYYEKANALMTAGRYLSYEGDQKALELFAKLKTDYSNSDYVKNDKISRYEQSLIIGEGSEAPKFDLISLKGKEMNLEKMKGRFVFIDFWGSWCGPCRGEIPHFKKLAKDINEKDLCVIGIARDDSVRLVEYIAKEKIEYPNALATEEVLKGIRNKLFSNYIFDFSGWNDNREKYQR